MKNHLRSDGFIAFEIRNPNLKWKDQWNYEIELNSPYGKVIESRQFLEMHKEIMKFELKYQFPNKELISTSEIRFWSAVEIEKLALRSGLQVEKLMGDWGYEELKPNISKEMVFFLRQKA